MLRVTYITILSEQLNYRLKAQQYGRLNSFYDRSTMFMAVCFHQESFGSYEEKIVRYI